MGRRTGRAERGCGALARTVCCCLFLLFTPLLQASGDGEPLLGVAKFASPVAYLGDRIFSTRIRLTLENFGEATLNRVSVVDDLRLTFGNDVYWFRVVAGSLQSETLRVNPAYDGATELNLLDPDNHLDDLERGTIEFVVEFRVRLDSGRFLNTAVSDAAEALPDRSTDGTNPDPNGDGTADEAVPTPIFYALPESPRLGLAKQAFPVEYQGDRVFRTTVALTLENLGDLEARDLQLTDDLSAVFGDRVDYFRIVDGSIIGEGLRINEDFDGRADMSLLAGHNSLQPHAVGRVRFIVEFRVRPDEGQFANTALASCAECTADRSTDGPDPDPNGDDDPAEDVPTPIPFAVPLESPAILGLAKSATFAETLSADERQTTITLVLVNYGSTPASLVNLEDDLTGPFASAVSFRVVPGSIEGSGLTVNERFDGNADLGLFQSGQSLAPEAVATVSYAVRFTVAPDTGDLFNTAIVDAANAASDRSQNGADPDPNGDRNPQEEQPTPIPYDPVQTTPAVIGLAKQLVNFESTGGGRYRGRFVLTLENFGPGMVSELELIDELRVTFPAPADYSVLSLESSTLEINNRFDGAGDSQLLAPGQALAEGATARVSVDFELQATGPQRFLNSAFLSGGEGLEDRSTDGADPDPDNDGDPAEDTPTPIELLAPPPEPPALSIEVTPRPRTTRVGRVVGYTIAITNTLDAPQNDVRVTDRAPDGFQSQVDDAILVRVGPDGRFDTGDDERIPIMAEGTALLAFAPFDLAPRETARILFPSRVTSAARIGPHPNKSLADSSVSSEVEAAAVVDIVADALFDRATIIGKVFHDRNGDGVQTPGNAELGVAAARIITPDGLIVQTDAQGRFHLSDIEINGRFGENMVLKLDTTSLPLNAISRSDIRQIVPLTAGGIGKVNFAVAWADRPGVSACCGPFQHLDYLTGSPPAKKLDVALRSIQPSESARRHRLEFEVASNYFDAAPCVQLKVAPIGDGTAVISRPQRIEGPNTRLRVAVDGRPHDQFSYTLFTHAQRDDDGACRNLLQKRPLSLTAADWTASKRFELPTRTEPTILPEVVLDSSLAGDNLDLPPVLAQRMGRRYEAGYDIRDVLTRTRDQFVDRVAHRWDAKVLREGEESVLRGGSSLETAGFLQPPQQGGADGAVRLERDQNFFEDGGNFYAAGLNAALTCCDIRTELETQLDGQNNVYAFRIKNNHQTAVELCFLTEAALDPAADLLVQATQCWAQALSDVPVVVAPGNTIERFQGSFRGGQPVHRDDWQALYVFVRELDPASLTRRSNEQRLGYRITRERRDGGLWTLPKTTGICGTVSSEIDITRTGGLAAQKLRSADVPVAFDTLAVPLGNAEVGSSNLYLAVLDFTLGGSSASGALRPLAEANQLGDSLFLEGRMAGYWRGARSWPVTPPLAPQGTVASPGQTAAPMPESHDLRWVLQMDSTKASVESFGDNLSRKDPRRLFRQLDSDNYYPTYGDDSTTILDTDSQGAFYARVELDDSSVLWGNYHTDFSGTEFAQFNRSLYGLSTELHSRADVASGVPRYSFRAFGSEAQSVSAQESFIATGGSLYYLRNTDIVLGSEKLWVEVRRRDTEQVEERQALVAGRDYEIDPLQGRIILSRPLNQVMRERYNPVVRTEALQGDNVFLFVDYEYLPDAFGADEYVYGARGQAWLNNTLAVGATHVTDEQGASDYRLTGLDLLLRYSDDSYLSVEYAETAEDRGLPSLLSFDGGLTFANPNRPLADPTDGQALGLEAQLSLQDFTDTQGQLRGWWKRREAGFSSSRYAMGAEVYDTGIDFDLALGSSLRLAGGATRLDRDGVADRRTARLKLAKEWRCAEQEACWLLDVEGRRDEVRRMDTAVFDPLLLGARDGTGSVLGLRLGRRLSAATTIYGALQKSFAADVDYGENDQVALGLNQRVNDTVAFSLELSDGDRGGALTAGVDYSAGSKGMFNVSTGIGPGALTQFATRYALTDGQELYGSYSVSPDRTDGGRNMLTLGQRRDLGRRTQVYSESQFGHQDRQASTGHLFGLDFGIADDLVLATTVQASRVDGPSGAFDRSAISFGGRYGTADLRLSSRLEQRVDEGISTDARQYLWSNLLSYRVGTSGRLLGKLNAALLDDARSDLDTGRFVEFELGYAHRPVDNDRTNGLLRYAYLYDVATLGQSDAMGDERAHVLSAEGFLDLSPRFQLGAKVAGRYGKSRLDKGFGDWQDIRLSFTSARLLTQLNNLGCTAAEQAGTTGASSAQVESLPRPERGAGLCWLPNKLELLTEYRWLEDWSGDNTTHGLLVGLYKQFDSRSFNSRLSNTLRIGVGYNFSGFNDDLRRNSYQSHGWFVDFTAAF